jgi:uncharacterized protein (TIGR02444 family)
LRLWDFALAVYARPGVEAACLTLQDEHHQSVSLLLWRLWALGRPLDAATLESALAFTRNWESRTVVPLRTVRRALAAPAPPVAEASRSSLREAVKAVELCAERALLEGLEALTPPGEAPGGGVHALAQLARMWSGPAPAGLLSHLADAAASVTGCRIA